MLSKNYISRVTLSRALDKESYLYTLPIVEYLANNKFLALDRDITIFVGENGTGKSTLLEAIAINYGFNPEGGTRNFSFSTKKAYSELYEHISLGKAKHTKDGFFLRAESFYNMASYIDDMDSSLLASYGGVSLHNQSHGESFLSLVQNRFGGNGVYILDEPEAALSPMRILTLIAEINALVKRNSQFIIATHSPILMALPGAKIYQLSEKGVASVTYKETEHYQISKLFLENPEIILKRLLED